MFTKPEYAPGYEPTKEELMERSNRLIAWIKYYESLIGGEENEITNLR